MTGLSIKGAENLTELREAKDGDLDSVSFAFGGDAELAAASHLASLTELTVPSGTTDAGLAGVAAFRHLHGLTVTAPAVTAAGFAAIAASLPELTRLTVLGTRADDALVAAIIAGFPALTDLTLQGCSISNGALADMLAARPAVGVNGRTTTDSWISALRAVPDLLAYRYLPERTATFPAGVSVGAFGYAGALGFASTVPAQGEIRVPALADGILHLGEAAIADPGLLAGIEPEAVQYVYATGEAVDDRVVRGLSALTGLTSVYLGAAVTDAGLSVLAALPALEGLDVLSTTITDRGLLAMLPAWSLRSLTLHGSGVTGAVLPELARLPHLRSLALHGASLGDGDVAAFEQGFPVLRSVSVAGSGIGPAGVLRLAEMRPGMAINGSELTEAGIRRMRRLVATAG